MRRFTHWLFNLTPLPRFVALLLLFLSLGGGLLLSLRGSSQVEVNQVRVATCVQAPPSVDPSQACADPTTYQDFRYVCGNGSEGYLGTEPTSCLTLEQATAMITTSCSLTCP